MKRTIVSLVVLVGVVARAASTPAADEAFSTAKAAALAVRKDEGKRKYRHQWQAAARKLEAVAKSYPKTDRAPDALYVAAELNRDLFRFSAREEDLLAAEGDYRALIDGWPKHRLMDDAAVGLARALLERPGTRPEARRIAERALANAQDRRKDLEQIVASTSRVEADLGSASRGKSSASDTSGRVESASRGKAAASEPNAPAEAGSSARGKALASEPNGRAEAGTSPRGKASASEPGERAEVAPSTRGKPSASEADAAHGKPSAATARAAPPASKAAGKQEDEAPSKRVEAKSLPSPAPSSGARAVADAIRRVSSPLAGLELRLPKDELPLSARRAPPPERPAALEAPPREGPGPSDATLEEPQAASPLAVLQESLRDVRVGARAPVDEGRVKSQLRAAVKEEAGSDVSLAQQLGLKMRRVVIDAGHGGHDTGAIGPKGTREKDVALAISLKLAARLKAMGLEVVLTRDDDSFVRLEERTALANRQHGDLFISVHCNAAPSHALRGIETYTLNTSSNRYSIRLAARENATSERGVGDLQYILADLATKAYTGESTRLAQKVQASIIHTLSDSYKNIRDLGTKEALFFVLLGAKMPAILVETSFVSNPEEEERLNDEKYQDSIAGSIAGALEAFLEERARVAQVD